MDKILIVIIAILSLASFTIALFQFKARGFLFNNAYLWASQKERQTMNKKPYYRQSAIVFSAIGVIFCLIAVETIVLSGWLNYIVFGIAVLLIVYAIVSSIRIEKNKA